MQSDHNLILFFFYCYCAYTSNTYSPFHWTNLPELDIYMQSENMCVPLSVLKRLWERGSSGKMVAVGRRCKQTVVKKATSYIIEGDVKASSLQGCQCQEAEPGWEQRAPPCLPLQRAAIYIVNTHTYSVSLCLSLSHTWSCCLSFFLFYFAHIFCLVYVCAWLSLFSNAQDWEVWHELRQNWNNMEEETKLIK